MTSQAAAASAFMAHRAVATATAAAERLSLDNRRCQCITIIRSTARSSRPSDHRVASTSSFTLNGRRRTLRRGFRRRPVSSSSSSERGTRRGHLRERVDAATARRPAPAVVTRSRGRIGRTGDRIAIGRSRTI